MSKGCCTSNLWSGKMSKIKTALILLGILLLYGIVGTMDYHDERMMECAQKNLNYDSDKDVCK